MDTRIDKVMVIRASCMNGIENHQWKEAHFVYKYDIWCEASMVRSSG